MDLKESLSPVKLASQSHSNQPAKDEPDFERDIDNPELGYTVQKGKPNVEIDE